MNLISILKENGTGFLSGHFKSNPEKSWNGNQWNTPNGDSPKLLDVKFSLGKDYLGEFQLEKLNAEFNCVIGHIKDGDTVVEVELKYNWGYSDCIGKFKAILKS